MATPTNIFIAYHAKDTQILDNLRDHLSPLERTEGVKIWYDGKINAGSETLVEIRRAMSEADIILLLVSSNFIASDFCYEAIMSEAILMHNVGKVKVIPIIVRDCMWRNMPFSRLRELPKNGVHITSKSWDTPDEPYTQIALELSKLISSRQITEEDLLRKKTRKRGRVLYRIPEKMQKNVPANCIIRIAPEDLPEEILKEALKNVDKAIIEDIRRIGKHMKVLLNDDSGNNAFLIKNKSSVEQVVEEDDYTEWRYEVTPFKEGRHKLLLTVSVTLTRDKFGKEYKDVIVLDREIDIITSEVNETYDWHKVEDPSPLMLVHSNVGQVTPDSISPPDKPIPVRVLTRLREYRRTLSVILLFLFPIPMVTWAAAPSLVTPIILNIQYDETRKLSNDRIAVKKEGKWGIVNKWGITSEVPIYEDMKDYENNIIQVKKDGKWGALEKTEKADDAWVKRVFSPKDETVIPILADTIETIGDNEATMRIGTEIIRLPMIPVDTIRLTKRDKEIRLQILQIYKVLERRDFEAVEKIRKDIDSKELGETNNDEKPLQKLQQPPQEETQDYNDLPLETSIKPKVKTLEEELTETAPNLNTTKTQEPREKIVKEDTKATTTENSTQSKVETLEEELTETAPNLNTTKTQEPQEKIVKEDTKAITTENSTQPKVETLEKEPTETQQNSNTTETTREPQHTTVQEDSTKTTTENPPQISEKGEISEINPNIEDKSIIQEILNSMTLVEGSTFIMGCTEEQGGHCNPDENPVHSVTLNSFFISKYEVTQAQYEEVMGKIKRTNKDCDRCPVGNITWNDAQAFIKKLNQMTGEKFRLPTEAEWEFAARGGIKSKKFKYAGSNNLDDVAWYFNPNDIKSHPVGTKSPNELGIYDMSGNIWEWCQDWYDKNYYENSPANNPKGPTSTQTSRVLRGGPWGMDGSYCRIAHRFGGYSVPTTHVYVGFRLAQTLE